MPVFKRSRASTISAQELLDVARDPAGFQKKLDQLDARKVAAEDAEEKAKAEQETVAGMKADVTAATDALGKERLAFEAEKAQALVDIDDQKAALAKRDETLGAKESAVGARETAITDQEGRLEGIQAGFNDTTIRQKEAATGLDAREAGLDQREAKISQREAAFDAKIDIFVGMKRSA